MTFKELQDAVLFQCAAEARRDEAKRAANTAYAQLWNADKWTFIYASQNVTVTANSLAVTLMPDDFAAVDGLLRDDGFPLRAIRRYQRFASYYIASGTPAGTPYHYTVLNGAISVGPKPLATSAAYLLLYEKAVTELDADDDVVATPSDLDEALVEGGKAYVLRFTDPARSGIYMQSFTAAIDAARAKHLRELDDVPEQWPADRPDTDTGIWGY